MSAHTATKTIKKQSTEETAPTDKLPEMFSDPSRVRSSLAQPPTGLTDGKGRPVTEPIRCYIELPAEG